MTRARVLFISGFSHPYGTEVHMARDLDNIGCEVTCRTERQLLTEQLGEPKQWDLMLYMKAAGLPPVAEMLWRKLEAEGVKTASVHLDLYYGLKREIEIGHDPFWKTQYVFTADGDPYAADYMRACGVNHHWLPPAIVSDETNRSSFDPTLASDVVFIGKTNGYHKEWPWRQELVHSLEMAYGERRFRIWGHDSRPLMRGQRLNDLCASVKVIVGDSLALPGHINYWSDRYYEIVGRGGFLVAPNVPGIEAHFHNGDHLLLYEFGAKRGLHGVLTKVDEALSWKPTLRNYVSENGRAHVAQNHTYKQRMDHLLQVVGL